MHTYQVAQSSTQSKDRACQLNTTLTSHKSFLFAKSCADFLAVVQHFSKVLQYDSITMDGVTQKFTATKERLENMLSSIGSAISKEAQNLGEQLIFEGEQLNVPQGYRHKKSVVTAVTTLMKKLISGAMSTLGVPFPSFKSNSVLLATGIFFPLTWQSDHSTLAKFGYDEVCLLSTHFSHLLQQRGCVPKSCVDEWSVYPSLVWMSELCTRVFCG